MNKRATLLGLTLAAAVALAWAGPSRAQSSQAPSPDDYARASAGTRSLSFGGGMTITMLFDAANLGSSEVELAEIVFPVGTNPPSGHRHGSMEFFYVVEGVLGHVVNGVEHRLEPGMAGVVKPGDEVVHRVLSDVPVRALVVWAPGGESDRIAPPDQWTPIGGASGGGF